MRAALAEHCLIVLSTCYLHVLVLLLVVIYCHARLVAITFASELCKSRHFMRFLKVYHQTIIYLVHLFILFILSYFICENCLTITMIGTFNIK